MTIDNKEYDMTTESNNKEDDMTTENNKEEKSMTTNEDKEEESKDESDEFETIDINEMKSPEWNNHRHDDDLLNGTNCAKEEQTTPMASISSCISDRNLRRRSPLAPIQLNKASKVTPNKALGKNTPKGSSNNNRMSKKLKSIRSTFSPTKVVSGFSLTSLLQIENGESINGKRRRTLQFNHQRQTSDRATKQERDVPEVEEGPYVAPTTLDNR